MKSTSLSSFIEFERFETKFRAIEIKNKGKIKLVKIPIIKLDNIEIAEP